MARTLWAWLALLPLLACGLPRDPEGTLERVRREGIRVGLAEAPPWVALDGGSPRGVEVELVLELARRLGTRVHWHPGDLEGRLAALHERELDLVAGGLTAETPWAKRVALTRAYYVESLLVGAAPGTSPPRSLRDARVAVEAGSGMAAPVRERGAVPLPVARLPAGHPLLAAPGWRLAAWRYEPVGEPLQRRDHVLAVAPGENAWLLRIEELLLDREAWVARRLTRREPP